MSEYWDVRVLGHTGILGSGMSRIIGCQSTGTSEYWDFRVMKCQITGGSEYWGFRVLGCQSTEISQ